MSHSDNEVESSTEIQCFEETIHAERADLQPAGNDPVLRLRLVSSDHPAF